MICGILKVCNFQKKNGSNISLEVNPLVILDKKPQSKGIYVWKYYCQNILPSYYLFVSHNTYS